MPSQTTLPLLTSKLILVSRHIHLSAIVMIIWREVAWMHHQRTLEISTGTNPSSAPYRKVLGTVSMSEDGPCPFEELQYPRPRWAMNKATWKRLGVRVYLFLVLVTFVLLLVYGRPDQVADPGHIPFACVCSMMIDSLLVWVILCLSISG